MFKHLGHCLISRRFVTALLVSVSLHCQCSVLCSRQGQFQHWFTDFKMFYFLTTADVFILPTQLVWALQKLIGINLGLGNGFHKIWLIVDINVRMLCLVGVVSLMTISILWKGKTRWLFIGHFIFSPTSGWRRMLQTVVRKHVYCVTADGNLILTYVYPNCYLGRTVLTYKSYSKLDPLCYAYRTDLLCSVVH